MNKTTTHGTDRGCCSDPNCEYGLRNNYFEGKRLTADSFTVEQKYSLGRRRLLNRAIHGWGVVYGYPVTLAAPEKSAGPGRLQIGPGLALDPCGRELLQTERPIEFSELIFLDVNGKQIDRGIALSQNPSPGDGPQQDVCWLLSVHYAEQRTGLVKVKDSCQCEYDEWDRICETVRYSLKPLTGCDQCCDDLDCKLKCDCASGPCCDQPVVPTQQPGKIETDTQAGAEGETADSEAVDGNREEFSEAAIEDPYRDPKIDEPDEHRPRHASHKRGGCHCLCSHLINLNPGAECPPLCEIDKSCGSVWADLLNGVPLACVRVASGECGVTFRDVDQCGPRRLVKRNDLLFDLVRGCDLTQIKDFGWKRWHRQSTPIDFNQFSAAFGPGDGNANEYVTRDFWVEFSRPVRRDTVHRDCFVMTIIFSESHDAWWQMLRVPIVRVHKAETELIDKAWIVVYGPWLRDTVKGAASIFKDKVRVELEVRGDFIVDCNGQTVDANAHGLSPTPTGNGTPGGIFLSTFPVGPAPSQPASDDNEDLIKGVS